MTTTTTMYRIHLLFHLMELFSISFFLLILFRRFFAILTFVKIAAIQRRRQTSAKNYTFEEVCGRAKENMKNDWRTTNTERQQTNNDTKIRIIIYFSFVQIFGFSSFSDGCWDSLVTYFCYSIHPFFKYSSILHRKRIKKDTFFTLVYSICVISFTFFVRNGLLDNFIFHIAFTEHLHITQRKEY